MTTFVVDKRRDAKRGAGLGELRFFKLSALAGQVGVIRALASSHQESAAIMHGKCLTSYDECLMSLA